MPTYPTRVTSFICEDLRQEVGKKATLLGVNFGHWVNVLPSAPERSALNLGFLFVFHDGEGDFTAKFELTGPDGPVGEQPAAMTSHKPPELPMVFFLQFRPTVPIPRGEYVASLTLSGTRFELRFGIRSEPSLPNS